MRKKLLVISSGYPNSLGTYMAHTFVKSYVDEAKNYFENVLVIVLLPKLPLLNNIFNKKYPNEIKNYSYENVTVFYEKYFYIPLWPFSKFRGKIAFLLKGSKISRLVDNETIIHANFTSPSGTFASLLFEKKSIEYCLTVHEDHDWLMSEVGIRNKYLIQAWENAKVLIRVNKLDNKLLTNFNKNVVTIPNGFDKEIFKVLDNGYCRKFLKIDSDKSVIINIGFYNKQKNQKLLIESISLLPSKIKKNIKCFIIGGGSKERQLREQVIKNKLEGIIEIVGQVNQNLLPIYLNSANIFCLSSNSEGNPTVMFEALGIGIPYVGTNVGGIPEIIISEKYGYLCEPNDVNGLKRIIKKGLIKVWNRNEILEYSKQFTWENIFLKTKQYY